MIDAATGTATTRPARSRRSTLLGTLALLAAALAAPEARAAEVRVMSSGGLTAALQAIAPDFERASGHHVAIVLGPSMGTSPDAIPNRLARGERADLVLMVGDALKDLAAGGRIAPESRVDLADSKIGMAVPLGRPRPDITTVEAFKKALLAAKSIAYSDSASGVYIAREMYVKLGLEDELKGRSRMIVAERVGNVVARGEAEIGFQQISELLPITTVALVGPIPDDVQRVTVFSAAIPTGARQPDAARALIAYFGSAQGQAAMVRVGLEPIRGNR